MPIISVVVINVCNLVDVIYSESCSLLSSSKCTNSSSNNNIGTKLVLLRIESIDDNKSVLENLMALFL